MSTKNHFVNHYGFFLFYSVLYGECWNSSTFFQKNFDTDNYEELEMDTYLFSLPKMVSLLGWRKHGRRSFPQKTRRLDCNGLRKFAQTFSVPAQQTTFLARFAATCTHTHKKQKKLESDLFRKELRGSEMSRFCSKTYCCYDQNSIENKFNSRVLNIRSLEDCGDETKWNFWKLVIESIKVISTNRTFQTLQRNVVVYEKKQQIKLSIFTPKILVEEDGIQKNIPNNSKLSLF